MRSSLQKKFSKPESINQFLNKLQFDFTEETSKALNVYDEMGPNKVVADSIELISYVKNCHLLPDGTVTALFEIFKEDSRK